MSSVLLMDAQSAMAGIFDQICGEDESIREKGLEYISTSLVQMRHKLFIPHPENEKFLVEMIKKVNNNYYRNLSNTTYEKKDNFNLKNARFSGKGRQSRHIIIINVMTFHRMLFSYITLDHTLYSINYGRAFCMTYYRV
jgi:hypothetical protein